MSYDNAVIENIKTDLNHIDVATLQSISEIIDQFKRKRAALPQAARDSEMPPVDAAAAASGQNLKFVGNNLPLPEYEKLSIKERRMLARRMKEQNQSWLKENFSMREAAWLVVMDGQVIASGKSLKDQPMQPQIAEIYQRTGKFPFVFINDAFMTIEESASGWHETNAPGDLYPTLPVNLSSTSGAANFIGDFDTGAARSFADYDFLVDKNVIQPELDDAYKSSRHLDQSFDYVTKFLRCKLPAQSRQSLVVEIKIHCVFDWRFSPFVAINPNRIALVGRDIMFELKPKVLLDFDKQQTEILKSGSAHQKTNMPKRHPPRSRRRS